MSACEALLEAADRRAMACSSEHCCRWLRSLGTSHCGWRSAAGSGRAASAQAIRVAHRQAAGPAATIRWSTCGCGWCMDLQQVVSSTTPSAPMPWPIGPRLAEPTGLTATPPPPTGGERPADAAFYTQKFQQGGPHRSGPSGGLRGDARRVERPDHNRDHFRAQRRRRSFGCPWAQSKQAYESYLVRLHCVRSSPVSLRSRELSRAPVHAIGSNGSPVSADGPWMRPPCRVPHGRWLRGHLRSIYQNWHEAADHLVPSLVCFTASFLSERSATGVLFLIGPTSRAHPDNGFCAAGFDFFALVPGRERPGDSSTLLIRCWPGLKQGFRGKCSAVFFCGRWFLTHSPPAASGQFLPDPGH